MEVLVVNVLKTPEHTVLVREFLEMRRQIFVSEMNWDLTVVNGWEFEQYDQLPLTSYVLAVKNGHVVGGARLLRCDTSYGTGTLKYTYMIKDAYLGAIDLPRGLCKMPPPSDDKSWELTRFVVDQSYPEAGRAILDTANDYLVELEATQCLFLGSPAFMRMARKYGYRPEPLGPVCGNKDGRFIAFSCPCERRQESHYLMSAMEARA